MSYHLILNPGSTSTKLGVYEGEQEVRCATLRHTQEQLAPLQTVEQQLSFQRSSVEEFLEQAGITLNEIDGIISIGGLIRPGEAGVYEVNEQMVQDLATARYDWHASNLGALIGWELGCRLGVKAYVADAITADEMQPVARLSGLKGMERNGRSHTLNQKYMAARAAQHLGLSYEDARLVVVHLGGGISVTAHRAGRMVDTNNARGEGPFCIDRTGGLNSYELVKRCFSGKYAKEEMLAQINGNGGVVSYLNTRDFKEVTERRTKGDLEACAVFDAMAYQIAKEIAAMSIPLGGKPHAIVLTGGMANSKELVELITSQVSFLGPVLCYPGEGELEALAHYLELVQKNRMPVYHYK